MPSSTAESRVEKVHITSVVRRETSNRAGRLVVTSSSLTSVESSEAEDKTIITTITNLVCFAGGGKAGGALTQRPASIV